MDKDSFIFYNGMRILLPLHPIRIVLEEESLKDCPPALINRLNIININPPETESYIRNRFHSLQKYLPSEDMVDELSKKFMAMISKA